CHTHTLGDRLLTLQSFRETPHGYLANCSPASFLASARASPSLAGSLPPAWAMVGLPPPLPPTTVATWPTSLPACNPFFTRSSVPAASRPTLPSSDQPMTTTELGAFCRRRSTCCLSCSSGPAGISPTIMREPFVSGASARSLSATDCKSVAA